MYITGSKMYDRLKYNVIDLDTNEEIKECVWANDETGEYQILVTDDNGQIIMDKKAGDLKRETKIGNIKLVKQKGYLIKFVKFWIEHRMNVAHLRMFTRKLKA